MTRPSRPSNVHHLPSSRRIIPASATPSRSTVAIKLRTFLPSLDTLQSAFLALALFNLAGLGAALWFDAPDAALDFTLGMAGAGVAMIVTSIVEGRR